MQCPPEFSSVLGFSSHLFAFHTTAVEEIDSADNSAAYAQNRAKVMSKAKLNKANAEYRANLETVQRLTADLEGHQKHMADFAKELQALKLTPPEQRPAPKSPQLDAAVQQAKELSLAFGNTSEEARLAWETVEELASSGLENAMGPDMTEECLVEVAEVCLALEELDRFISDEKKGGLSN